MSRIRKSRKLPDRYPREKNILVVGDMSELDHVLNILDEIGADFENPPEDVSPETWKTLTLSPLNYLAKQLRTACQEFARFWRAPHWAPENDRDFRDSMIDPHELHWYIQGIEAARFYDPAFLSCAKALHYTLLLQHECREKEWALKLIADLRYELTRYHAAAREILQERNAAFAPGRVKGATSNLNRCLQKIFWRNAPIENFNTFWRLIDEECKSSEEGSGSPLRLQEIDDDTLYYMEGRKERKVTKQTIRNTYTKFRKKYN